MRFRTRHFLALTLVASALCADRATADLGRADPTPARAGGLVDRLTVGLRRTVPPLVRQRCPWSVAATDRPTRPAPVAAVAPPPVCPACLPLPPPLV